MNRILLLILIAGSLCVKAQSVSKQFTMSQSVVFEENKGQIADVNGNVQNDILFTLKSDGATVFFRKHGLSYQFNVRSTKLENQDIISEATGLPDQSSSSEVQEVHSYRVDMLWNNTREDVELRAMEPTDGVSNYYLAHCSEGIRNVKSYRKIIYNEIYPGIDIAYYINDRGHLKYDVLIKAGADPSQVSYSYNGAEPILEDGKIRINTPLGFIEEQVPVAWIADCKNEMVNVEYKKIKTGIGYNISSNDKTVVLDPEIIWATYYGSLGNDVGIETEVDSEGKVFLAGETASNTNIAIAPGHYTSLAGGLDAFLVKFNSDGTRAWASYFGGTLAENVRSMAIDPSGNILLVGKTLSTNIPKFNPYQTAFGNIFIVKFSSGGACTWSSYYGFSNNDQDPQSIATDASGNFYIAGTTQSYLGDIDDSPIGHDRDFNSEAETDEDAFLVKFNSAGNTQLWATYYGGSKSERGNGVAVDENNNVYLCGYTGSAGGNANSDHDNTIKTINEPWDSHEGFLVKFNEAGVRQWGTYHVFEPESISIDNPGHNIILGGSTTRTNKATPGAFQPNHGGDGILDDAFVSKYTDTGTLLWASYFGGTAEDRGLSTTVDKEGHVFLSGQTKSAGLASKGFDDAYFSPNFDAFVVMISADGTSILWSTYFGALNNDLGRSIAKDFSGIYLAGNTASDGLASDGVHQDEYKGGGSDAFLVKIKVPEIVNENFPEIAEKNGSTPVSITLNNAANSTVRFWKKGISTKRDIDSWTSETISPDGTTFTKNLSSTDLTDPIGISYYFQITDISQVAYTSDSAKAHIHYSIGDNVIPELRFGNQVSDYQIISTPLVLDNNTVTSVLDELGPYDKKKWRLFHYYDEDNREYPAFSGMLPGLGYWLIIKNSIELDPGAGVTVAADEDNPFEISLKEGWNLIGNPYDFPIAWSDVMEFNENPVGVGDLAIFTGSGLLGGEVLDRYRGAFVFSESDVTIKIPVLRNTSLGGRKGPRSPIKNSIDKEHWDVPLIISHQHLTNELGAVGMHPDAKLKGKDTFDQVSVPLLEGMGFFELQIDHEEVNASFSKDIVPTSDEYTWFINIRRDDPIPLDIKWDNSTFGTNDKQLYLLNPATMHVVNMRETKSMQIGPEVKQVQVIYGGQSYVDEILDEQLPALGNPYPVPSNGRVNLPVRIPKSTGSQHIKMDVYDSKGAIVSNLINEPFSPGQYTFEWESKHAGLYLVQLRMNNQVMTRKIIIH